MFDKEVDADLLATADSVWEALADLAVIANDSIDARCGCQQQGLQQL
ncbi:MAG: hypothetical protein ACRDZ3_05995 [Acidimicrobiia bacterium]